MEEGEEYKNIIIDNGTGYYRAGFAGDKLPKLEFTTSIGYPKFQSQMGKAHYIIGEVPDKIDDFKFRNPIERGVVENWDDMEKIWDYGFKELKVEPSEYNILLTDVPRNPKENREKMAQYIFESFKGKGLFVIYGGSLAAFANGKFSAMIVDCGEGVTQFVPVYEAYSVENAIKRIDFGGIDLTDFMLRMIIDKIGVKSFTHPRDIEQLRSIKEKSCYVAYDIIKEENNYSNIECELPDGTTVNLGYERFRCPEALFKPSIMPYLVYKEYKSIIENCNDAILETHKDKRKDLYNSIILAGGSLMFEGLQERFTKEIKSLASDIWEEEINVIASSEGKNTAWIGGSILSIISPFQNCWITKEEYEESGPYIVHKKC